MSDLTANASAESADIVLILLHALGRMHPHLQIAAVVVVCIDQNTIIHRDTSLVLQDEAWRIGRAQQKTQTNQEWQRCIERLQNLQTLAMISPANCCKQEKSSCISTNKQSYSPARNNMYGIKHM